MEPHTQHTFCLVGGDHDSGIKQNVREVQGRNRTKGGSQSPEQATSEWCLRSFCLRGLLPILEGGPQGRASLSTLRLRP